MAGTVFYNAEKADYAIKNRDNMMMHVEQCILQGFSIEAIVILHSMMENYTYKLLRVLRIPYKASDRLFQCLEYLKMHVNEKDICAQLDEIENEVIICHLNNELFVSGLAEAIGEWRKERNLMIHDVAIEELSAEKYTDMAMQGKRLFEEYEQVIKRFLL